ncbi:hypothetical protein [Pantoea cypripedii]|uniref:Uncharacterized protein n=1 Tax=Pantoea cypripedii TaxID=55209 RepID=A0A1X1F048_PANCY|nr:hypothetical protein [Pantoea cypripedii]MBP2195834.1 hypothetical protein [Pantoea cypripedii]ORM95650.1 hypothetical protein HA50_20760 [Pantoea cypripedii]
MDIFGSFFPKYVSGVAKIAAWDKWVKIYADEMIGFLSLPSDRDVALLVFYWNFSEIFILK